MNQSVDYSDGADDGAVSSEPAQRFEAQAGAGERVDRFLARLLAPKSRTLPQRWFELGAVTVDGRDVLPLSPFTIIRLPRTSPCLVRCVSSSLLVQIMIPVEFMYQ